MSYSSFSTQDLIEECFRTGSEEAWKAFVERFNRFIEAVVYRTARRHGLTARARLEDLVQEVYLKLYAERTRLLGRFDAKYPDVFYGFLKTFAANLVQDHFKASTARKRGYGVAPQSLTDHTWISGSRGDHMDQRLLLLEIDTELINARFSNEERLLFWLYYRNGFTAAALSQRPATTLSLKGVESLLGRMARSVRARLCRQKRL